MANKDLNCKIRNLQYAIHLGLETILTYIQLQKVLHLIVLHKIVRIRAPCCIHSHYLDIPHNHHYFVNSKTHG